MGYYARKSLENIAAGVIDIETDIKAVAEMQGIHFAPPDEEVSFEDAKHETSAERAGEEAINFWGR